MENTVGYRCYFSSKEARLVLCRVGGFVLSIRADCARFFVSCQPYCFQSINSTILLTEPIIARESMILFLYRGFWWIFYHTEPTGWICRLTLQSGQTQAYIGLLLLHLNFEQFHQIGVHWGNPPSPWVIPCWTQVFIGLYLLGFTALL